ncbi:MAG: ATP-dependent protease subunit HslV [Planctomycetota bacterium]
MYRATTIVSVRRNGKVAIGGDGQVTLGDTVVKHDANKIRKLLDGEVLVGFAGASADAFALMERFESVLKDYQGNVLKAATELAKQWRTDRVLRRLESLLAVVTKEHSLMISGSGDVIVPSDETMGIGSGGAYALAAAKALLKHSKLSAKQIVEEALNIAADICVYTNTRINIEEL